MPKKTRTRIKTPRDPKTGEREKFGQRKYSLSGMPKPLLEIERKKKPKLKTRKATLKKLVRQLGIPFSSIPKYPNVSEQMRLTKQLRWVKTKIQKKKK